MRMQMGQKAAASAMANRMDESALREAAGLSPRPGMNSPRPSMNSPRPSMSPRSWRSPVPSPRGEVVGNAPKPRTSKIESSPEVSRISRARNRLNEIEMLQAKHEGTPIQRNFDLVMGGVIVANIFWIAIEMDFGPAQDAKFADGIPFWLISSIFLAVFILEICVRVYWERLRWVFGFWNWFDLIVVICGIIDLWLLPFFEGDINLKALSILRLARLVRLVRMVKLVKTMQSLYIMVMAFLHALRSMGFLAMIMFFGILIYAIFATVLIGRNSSFDDVRIYDDTVYDRFGKVYRSMYSLFELMTLEGWERVARPLVEKQPLTFLFIGTFIMIFTYGLLNMVVATVVEQTLVQTSALKEADQQEAMKNLAEQLRSMKEMFMDGDADGDSSLSKIEFDEALEKNPVLKECLVTLGVPENEAKSLFMVLDEDMNEELTIAELVHGIGKLTDGGQTAWDRLVIEGTMRSTKEDTTRLQKQVFVLEARLREQNVIIKELHQMMGGMRGGSGGGHTGNSSNPPAAYTTQATLQPTGSSSNPPAANIAQPSHQPSDAQAQSDTPAHEAPRSILWPSYEAAAPVNVPVTEACEVRTAHFEMSSTPKAGRKREPDETAIIVKATQASRVLSAGRGRPPEDSGSGPGDNAVIEYSSASREPVRHSAWNSVVYSTGTKRIQVQPPAVPLHERQLGQMHHYQNQLQSRQQANHKTPGLQYEPKQSNLHGLAYKTF